ncbi:serine hydrolase [Pseudonocardia sp. ICBG601]|uniref:serine hydrolase domain-containing protein n=1 Tax=Pseudonocardia sp. ICBG601 TaxID=2846759 RepID=UPI001CF67A08|nr:serine hydrolase domain-containing protein [Pseudonocardia sp. ICBG601]
MQLELEKAGQEYIRNRNELTLTIGLTQNGHRSIFAFRSPDAQYVTVPDERTLYEIGSFSKVYTTSVLSILVSQGVLSFTDTIADYFPDLNIRSEVGEITVFDLATHTSGLSGDGVVLARMISEAVSTEDPTRFTYYADYTKAHLDEELEAAELVRPRGSGWEYSRTGLSVLGHILEVASGQTFESLLKRHLGDPLGLVDTAYTLSTDQSSRLVRGYYADGTPSPNWYWDIMLPQGGIRSTMADMLTFIEANLAHDDSELTTALRFAQETEFEWPAGSDPANTPYGSTAGFRQAIGWWNLDRGHGPVSQHAGATMSYQSFGALHRKSGTGLVAMTSSAENLQDVMEFPQMGQRLIDFAVERASAVDGGSGVTP